MKSPAEFLEYYTQFAAVYGERTGQVFAVGTEGDDCVSVTVGFPDGTTARFSTYDVGLASHPDSEHYLIKLVPKCDSSKPYFIYDNTKGCKAHPDMFSSLDAAKKAVTELNGPGVYRICKKVVSLTTETVYYFS
jgi:hypothetical protein